MRMDALWIRTCAGMCVCTMLLFGVFMLPSAVHAQEESVSPDAEVEADESGTEAAQGGAPYAVTPVVTNEKAKPRDIIKKELLVTNNTGQRIDLYITVENIDPTEGAQAATGPTESDLSVSLANWVEITRGVIELGPNESRKVPYLIHVNLTAKPGSYFARIMLRNGSNRAEAEAKKDGATLLLNLEVLDDAKERLQLGNFTSDSSVVLGKDVSFTYLLENIGNRQIEPRGSIRIFNRRGEEVGSVPLNADGEQITPEDKKQLAAVWSAAGRFGKYKAYLDLEYGENQLASVQDTVYFWVFPWKEIMASVIGVIVLGVLGTFIVHLRAVARPARARARVPDPSPAYGTPRPEAPSYTDAPYRERPSPVREHTGLVIAPRQQAVSRSVSIEPRGLPKTNVVASESGTVMLSPRSRHAPPTVHGATVELRRR